MKQATIINVEFPKTKIATEYEKMAFAFTCYGVPSFSELVQFCHFYECDSAKIFEALVSLSGRRLVKIIIGGSPCYGLYLPVFFSLTETGTSLFRQNYNAVMNFLVAPKFWGISAKHAKETFLNEVKNFRES